MTKSRGFTASWSKVKGVNYVVGKCFRSHEALIFGENLIKWPKLDFLRKINNFRSKSKKVKREKHISPLCACLHIRVKN